jgi:hypothetical protein
MVAAASLNAHRADAARAPGAFAVNPIESLARHGASPGRHTRWSHVIDAYRDVLAHHFRTSWDRLEAGLAFAGAGRGAAREAVARHTLQADTAT